MLSLLDLAFLIGKFYAKTSFVAARRAINVMQTLLVLHAIRRSGLDFYCFCKLKGVCCLCEVRIG